MQVVKFRVWDMKRKEMVYINDLYFFEEEGIHEIIDGIAKGHHTAYKIMQYTSMKDKKGKRVYEGDIISYRDRVYESDEREVICFIDGGFGTKDWWLRDIGEYEVVGNVYENPELIEESEMEDE
ncbi:YopX family protein [Bacillus mycoides]|uniref:YopX family protein n=1 Tax=Bacillus mycoides TaxID=1405 RepID=UPI003D64E912